MFRSDEDDSFPYVMFHDCCGGNLKNGWIWEALWLGPISYVSYSINIVYKEILVIVLSVHTSVLPISSFCFSRLRRFLWASHAVNDTEATGNLRLMPVGVTRFSTARIGAGVITLLA